MTHHLVLITSLSLIVSMVSCMDQSSQSGTPRIEIVSSEKFDSAKAAAVDRLKAGPGSDKNWERFHESVKSVLRKYGTVSWDPDPLPDYYFSGDWFHENSDRFTVYSPKCISKDLLHQLPPLLAAHHPDAILEIVGVDKPIEGLSIMVTSKIVLVRWDGSNRDEGREQIRKSGIDLE